MSKPEVSLTADVSAFVDKLNSLPRSVAIAKYDGDGSPLTVPVSDEVLQVIHEWAYDHGEDLNTRLEPFGLGRHNIVMPEFRRVVEEGEQ